MKNAPFLVYPARDNRDEDGNRLDLFAYTVNEYEARKIRGRVKEVGGLVGAARLMREAVRQIRKAGYDQPSGLASALVDVERMAKVRS